MAQHGLTRFYLHVHSGVRLEDPDGADFPDLAAAYADALQAARELWAEAMLDGRDLCDDRLEITSEAGECLMVVPFTDALPDGVRKRLSPA